MRGQDFVELLKVHVARSAVDTELKLLESPPGRSPSKELLDESAWYRQLSAENQAYVRRAIAGGVYAAVFGFLCMLDGVRRVVDDPNGKFILTYSDSAGSHVLDDGETTLLHELFAFDWYPGAGWS